MNLRAAAAIMGCEIEVESNDDGFFLIAVKDGKPIALSSGENLKHATKQLVERVYALNRQSAAERDDYRCSRCGRIAPLQSHHVKHRARGQRNDSKDNIESLCAACHGKEHGG